jgi:anti-anti-sigma factor
MELSITKEKNVSIVSVKGRLDAISSPEFSEKITELMKNGEKAFIIDFGGLEYISSAGLRSILAAAKSLKEKEGCLTLCTLKDVVKEVFEVSGFSAIIPIRDSLESAMTEFAV